MGDIAPRSRTPSSVPTAEKDGHPAWGWQSADQRKRSGRTVGSCRRKPTRREPPGSSFRPGCAATTTPGTGPAQAAERSPRLYPNNPAGGPHAVGKTRCGTLLQGTAPSADEGRVTERCRNNVDGRHGRDPAHESRTQTCAAGDLSAGHGRHAGPSGRWGRGPSGSEADTPGKGAPRSLLGPWG